MTLIAMLALAACNSEPPFNDTAETEVNEASVTPTAPPEEVENLASAANVAQPSTPGDDLVITPAGYGTIRIGAAPGDAAGYALADDGSFTDACRIYSSKQLPGAYAIVEKGIVQRLSFGQRASKDIRTDRGIAVGDSIADVRRAYPGIAEEPHKYVENAYYLTAGGSNGQPGIRFETDNEGKVTIIHVGLAPVLSYVESCA